VRLYLSSFRLGDHPERLTAMLPAQARVAVIGNALDAVPQLRPDGVALELAALTGLGLTVAEHDLRTDDPRDLTSYDGVWVRGGNVFVLREALRRGGADEQISGLIRSGEIVYAGYSAGACVLAPSLRGLELCDDPGDAGEVTWDGLGVLDHAIVPHLDSPGHPETDLVARVAARYDQDGTPYTGLSDGQALVVDGPTRELA
jgi:dipeptidase E